MNRDNFNQDINRDVIQELQKKDSKTRGENNKQKLTKWQKIKAFFANERTKLAIGVILILVGIFLLISFISFFFSGAADQSRVQNYSVITNAHQPAEISNVGAALGALSADALIAGGVGLAAFIIVIWCIVIGLRLIRRKPTNFFSYTFISIFSIIAMSIIIGAFTYRIDGPFYPLGGSFGKETNIFLEGLVGVVGLIIVNVILAMIWVLLCYNTIKYLYFAASNKAHELRAKKDNEPEEVPEEDAFLGGLHSHGRMREKKEDAADDAEAEKKPGGFFKSAPKRPKKTPKPADDQTPNSAPAEMALIKQSTKITNPNDPTGEYIHYVFPTLDLLPKMEMRSDSVDVEEQESNKRRIKETLGNYGIGIKSIDVHVGPTVTLFEIVPDDGVRVSRIRNLEDDIALSLSAIGIRIIAPMPGRGTIGIEIPNRDPQVVPMRTVLGSDKFVQTKAKLPMVLGSTVSNEVFVADLTKMPHLLVAGATGQGKSVGLNAIIASLLYKKGPSELKLLLVDPKKVEFSLYADLDKYFFAHVPGVERSIINDPRDVVIAMNSLVQEMENRYLILEEVHERNIVDYNNKWKTSLRNIEDEEGKKKYQFLPYIVVVIDEFADLIMQSGKEVESPIVRIAQKARAVGIHLIIATQRPDVKVITGLIKANFPGRIAFRVSQMVDSRTIIDQSGAQRLIGKGDMLFSANGEMTRLQCPFIDTPEVEKICAFIREQEDNDKFTEHEKPFMLPEYTGPAGEGDEGGGAIAGSSGGDRDPLFDEVARYIVQSDMASTSSIQRRWQIGYNRAGRIMDQMEAAGIVGPAFGGKPRKVLIDPMTLEGML